MIDKYEIKKHNNHEVLYLYINVNYEFSLKDFNQKKEDLKKYIKKYLEKNQITFKGNIVNIIIGGFLVGSVFLNNYQNKSQSYSVNNDLKYVGNEVVKKTNDITLIQKVIELKKQEKVEEEEKKKSNIVTNNKEVAKKNSTAVKSKKSTNDSKKSSAQVTKKSSNKVNTDNTKTNTTNNDTSTKKDVDNNIYINLNRGGRVQKIELEEYIIGVVGAEMPASFNTEALKAQAIISRTYALKARSKGKALNDNESNQSYKSNSELQKMWGTNYNAYYNKIKNAVKETKGKYLTYKGNYIEAVFHSTSNGRTENSVDVWGNSFPYLVSVESKYDDLNSSFIKVKKISYYELSQKLGFTVNIDTAFSILNRTSGNRVNRININDVSYTGVKIRNLLGLRSADFDIKKEEDGITFTTRGYGHGVGLSQYGANGYAKNGWNYQKILLHYYPGVTLKSL